MPEWDGFWDDNQPYDPTAGSVSSLDADDGPACVSPSPPPLPFPVNGVPAGETIRPYPFNPSQPPNAVVLTANQPIPGPTGCEPVVVVEDTDDDIPLHPNPPPPSPPTVALLPSSSLPNSPASNTGTVPIIHSAYGAEIIP